MKINLRNNHRDFSRIKIIPKNSSNYISANIGVDNPTLMVDDNKMLSVCLSPDTRISCEGALVYCDTGGVWDVFIVNVNGVDYPDRYGPELSEILFIDEQGSELHWRWYNKTSETIRVEIRNATIYEYEDGWGEEPVPGEETNPTRVVNFEEKTVKFCLSPGINCEPVGADVLEIDSLPAGKYYLNYTINNGEVRTLEYIAELEEHPYDVAKALFGMITDDKGWRLIVLGGGSQAVGEDGEYHPAPFWAYLFKGIMAAETMYGDGEEYINEPVTITFVKIPRDDGTDAVDVYFGQSTTIHACSYKTWMAV